MFNLGELYQQFSLATGLTGEEAQQWAHLITAAGRDLLAMLKPEVDRGRESLRIQSAALALAVYRYHLFAVSADSVDSFDMGDVKIRKGIDTAVKSARAAYDSALAGIAPLLKDTRFAVRTTGGLP